MCWINTRSKIVKWIDSRKKNGNDFSKQESPALQQKINGEPCPLYIAGSKISRNFSTAINKYVSGSIARNYWSDNKQSFGEGSFDVELSATDDAMKSIPMPRQHWLTKHTSGFNEEGKNMLRRKEWTHSKCPDADTQSKIWACNQKSRSWRIHQGTREVDEEQKHCSKHHRAICLGLQSWNKEQSMDTFNFFKCVQKAIAQQELIGWYSGNQVVSSSSGT